MAASRVVCNHPGKVGNVQAFIGILKILEDYLTSLFICHADIEWLGCTLQTTALLLPLSKHIFKYICSFSLNAPTVFLQTLLMPILIQIATMSSFSGKL